MSQRVYKWNSILGRWRKTCRKETSSIPTPKKLYKTLALGLTIITAKACQKVQLSLPPNLTISCGALNAVYPSKAHSQTVDKAPGLSSPPIPAIISSHSSSFYPLYLLTSSAWSSCCALIWSTSKVQSKPARQLAPPARTLGSWSCQTSGSSGGIASPL